MVVAVVVACIVAVQGPHRHVVVHTATVAAPPAVIAVDGADKDAKPDDPVALTPKARDVATELAVGAEKGTNDLNPVKHDIPLAGSSVHVGANGQILKVVPVARLEAPFASDSVPGCRTRTLTTNWSARAPGVRIEALELHYTAGSDIPNSRSDVDGLTAFGNQPSSAVSWHLNLDKDGNCDYNVPYREKAWTIADLNSATVNIETAGRGEGPYLRPAGYRELARIWVDFHRRYPYIPLRLGATDGHCNVTRPGVMTHVMGGTCSGGHVDINPLAIRGVIATLRVYVAKLRPRPCAKRTACRMGRRHAEVHKAITAKCHGEPAKTHVPACRRLRARNAYMHRYAAKHKLVLVTR